MWKVIENFSNYSVSEKGQIKNTKTGRLLKLISDKDGYLCTLLKSDEGYYKKFSAHRLVAITYIDNPKRLPMVNHKDEIKTNNRVENLEWCDNIYNKTYSNGKQILQFTMDGVLVRGYSSIREAERITGFNSTNISLACKKIYQTSQGYIWKYSSDVDVTIQPIQWLLLTV